MMKKLLYLSLVVSCCSCALNTETEKYQTERDNIVDVHDKLKEIKIGDVLINAYSRLFLVGDYLIIGDHKASDKVIHLFDKASFRYVASTGFLGQGPGEIANLGYIAADEKQRRFYVTDHGKQKIFSYSLDSILANPSYIPEVKMDMKAEQFPDKYKYINDSLCIGRIIEPIGNSDFKQSLGKWNMSTREITRMKYEHPGIEKKRVCFALSMDNGIYAEAYSNHDLISICTLDGDLKYNIYGSNWDNKKSNKIHYFDDVEFCNDKIVASYSGGENNDNEYYPSKFIVFDLTGNYIKTLDLGCMMYHFCYDKENNRIIMSLNDEMEYAYLDLDGLME